MMIICIYKYILYLCFQMKTSQSKYCDCIYFSANALARKTEKLALESWKPVDLSPSLGYLLMLVIEEPGVQPGTLSHHLQLTPSTITRLIERLEEKKLVVRTYEGKLTNVYPSPKGKTMLPELKACQDNFHQRYTKALGADESCRLVRSMNKLADKLEG